MTRVEGDTRSIVRMGSSIKNLGYAQIAVIVGSILIGFALAASIIGVATRSGSVEEFIIDFKDTLRFYLILLLLLSLITTFFFYKFLRAIKFTKLDREFVNPSLSRVEKLITFVIILQIVGVLIGIYVINTLMQKLDDLATSNPTSEDFENFANDLNLAGETIVSVLVALTANVLLLMAFNSIKDWIGELHSKTGIFWLSEASSKLGTVTTGITIIIISQVLTLITLDTLGSLLGLIGIIIQIVGYIQFGNRLDNMPYNLNEKSPMLQHSQPGSIPPPAEQTLAYNQPTSEGSYCPDCGYSNLSGSRFCDKCGSKLIGI